MPKVFAALALLSIVAACTSKDDSSADSSAVDASSDSPIACTSASECPTQSRCLYPVAESCGATGQCVHFTVGVANCAVDPNLRFCGCDGVSFFPGCAYGTDSYANPVAHTGACFDGGVSDRTCTSDRDCPEADTGCGYATADGCTAIGHCVTIYGGGFCKELFPRCACNGKSFSECAYQDGYASAPVEHAGLCADSGVSDASTDGASE
jgi:hypothetical protein